MKQENRKRASNTCPPDELFLMAFQEKGGLSAKEALITHLQTCARCKLKFEVLLQVRNRLQGQGPFRRRAPLGLKRPLVFATSLAGLVIILLGGLFFILKQQQDKAYRGSIADRLTLIEPAGRLSAPPSVFRWTPVKDTDYYDFELVDDELTRITSKKTTQIQVVLNAEDKAKLKKGTAYVWTVRAKDEWNHLLDSASGSFEIE